ncbi:MAG: homoserine kinase [gamma proteobacterium symbiont of Bathyaustriella thionipta]|nr:homoserine kinase [gamma proteobacterium symbiont of Bathyaustriella thionipta]MCU7951103.1 homoserine kinase [gamma proteobacterium symbiont of Bathyaustriella thionipta]MCU7951973.1 homoserine kinase [gamma proteobacterium symbiont of Bathyaustriella thionipta]MCU7957616.1 homoserine kinase [gamma proteobacterium symbiont of Bathyaustriella thionipta]MCU7968750.1 homoserine kinase [gamma proteobacterium symbiont of Bathyaustriella thionipta]
MAVYTSLSLTQLKQLLTHYELGNIISFAGIADGIENTNYYVNTNTGNYVLTIFEHYTAQELSYFLHLMHFLRQHGMIVPEPIADSKQQTLNTWQTKPFALFNRLSGKSIVQSNTAHCRQIGTALGQLHQIGQNFTFHRSNPWGFSQIQAIGKAQEPHLDKDDALLLSDELSFQYNNLDHHLIKSVIHADLFRDNVLFESRSKALHLSGILDFYTACHAPLLFDLAICVNDWCPGKDNYLDLNKTRALLNAYQQVRPLDDNEKQNWSTMLRAAALRFWLSRLSFQQVKYQQVNTKTELTPDKDPDVLKCLLLKHRENITFCQSLIHL